MKNFWLIISLLFSGLLLTGCNKTVVENCWDDCINESDIDVLEHKCMEYVNKALFDNIEKTPNPTIQYFYDNSWSMEYTFTDAQFSWTYYWIKWYAKAWDKSQNFICNIYTGWWLHDLYFYNDKSNNEEPVIEEQKQNTLTEKDYQAKPLDDWWDWSETNDDFWYTIYAKVVQSWNFNNYINNEYGFEFNLPESWNDWILVHFLTISNSNEIISDTFHLVYPRKGLEWQKVKPVFPTWWDTLILMNVVWLDTTSEELNAQLLSDDNAIKNNKYKFLFSIQDAPVNVFDWKVSKSDLECWKSPNCYCSYKEEYMNWGIRDKMPNPHADLWCYLVTILKNHMKLFNI